MLADIAAFFEICLEKQVYQLSLRRWSLPNGSADVHRAYSG